MYLNQHGWTVILTVHHCQSTEQAKAYASSTLKTKTKKPNENKNQQITKDWENSVQWLSWVEARR